MSDDRSTKVQRQRFLIAFLDEKLDYIKANLADGLRQDRKTVSPWRQRILAFRLGPSEFLLSYHEIDTVPGSAILRMRTQPFHEAIPPTDDWRDLATLGELDDALRAARATKGYSTGDLKAIRHVTRHEGETPEGLILVGVSGSHAYGLQHEGYPDPDTGENVPPSDLDRRGVYAVPTKEVLSLGRHQELVEQRAVDTAYDEVERFITLCLKANPERLEMLASRKTLVTPEGQLLVDNQGIFLSRRIVQSYGLYAKNQLMRIERRKDRSMKPAMHLIRLMITGIRALRQGVIDCDMATYRERLLAVKFGKTPMPEVFRWYEDLEIEMARAVEATKIPEEPDRAKANDILLEIRQRFLRWD